MNMTVNYYIQKICNVGLFPFFFSSFSGRSFVPSYSASDRSFKPGEDHRTTTLKSIENYLTGMGGVVGNGHACVLRAICEVKS